jgi:hypothetical protein
MIESKLGGMITARHVYQRNMTFLASHSLFTTTKLHPDRE